MFLGVVQVRNISNYSYIKTSLHACVPSFSVVGLVIFVTPSVQSACPLSIGRWDRQIGDFHCPVCPIMF